MVGIWPISNLIDKRKLLLYGQFCVLDPKFRENQLFAHRLTMYMSTPNKENVFISDIFKIKGTYKIAHVITEYVHSASYYRKVSILMTQTSFSNMHIKRTDILARMASYQAQFNVQQ